MRKIKKLVLKKETIASLSSNEQNIIRGGYNNSEEQPCGTAILGTDCGNSCAGGPCMSQLPPTCLCLQSITCVCC